MLRWECQDGKLTAEQFNQMQVRYREAVRYRETRKYKGNFVTVV